MTVCLALVLLAVAPTSLLGQGRGNGGRKPPPGTVTVTAQQDLGFGMLTAGIANSVYVDEVARRAEWQIQARGQVTVTLVLPAAMTGPSGAQLPLTFRAGDAGFQPGGATQIEVLDPRTPFTVSIPSSTAFGLLFLGGTARPALDQAAGTYTATVTAIVAQL